jgi:hypothetical protein
MVAAWERAGDSAEAASLAPTMPVEPDGGVEGASSAAVPSAAIGGVTPRWLFRISRFAGGEDDAGSLVVDRANQPA